MCISKRGYHFGLALEHIDMALHDINLIPVARGTKMLPIVSVAVKIQKKDYWISLLINRHYVAALPAMVFNVIRVPYLRSLTSSPNPTVCMAAVVSTSGISTDWNGTRSWYFTRKRSHAAITSNTYDSVYLLIRSYHFLHLIYLILAPTYSSLFTFLFVQDRTFFNRFSQDLIFHH